MDVLKNKKKHAYDYKRILSSDLSYPIILLFSKKHDALIVDGMHRLAKLYLENGKYIQFYMFDDELMEKFLIDKNADWERVTNTRAYVLYDLFRKHFNVCKCNGNDNEKLASSNSDNKLIHLSFVTDKKNKTTSIESLNSKNNQKKIYKLYIPEGK
jgi:hypothetical protein